MFYGVILKESALFEGVEIARFYVSEIERRAIFLQTPKLYELSLLLLFSFLFAFFCFQMVWMSGIVQFHIRGWKANYNKEYSMAIMLHPITYTVSFTLR